MNAEWGRVRANGLSFGYIERGEGPLVLALHGFPDLPRTFRYQMEALAAAGYRVIAPYMRGYFPTEAPADASYEAAALVQDALALMEALGEERVVVMGHDWGAVAAYGAAIHAPERVAKLVALAVPPGGAVGRSWLANPAQQRRSWYMYFFQMPVAEAAVMHDDFAFLERLWQEWSPGWQYRREDLAAVKEALRAPGGLQAALNYYRHTFNPAKHSPSLAAIRARLGEKIPVPTLYIHGASDGGIGAELAEGIESAFARGVEKHIIPGAGHFVHQEKHEEVNRLLLEFLQR